MEDLAGAFIPLVDAKVTYKPEVPPSQKLHKAVSDKAGIIDKSAGRQASTDPSTSDRLIGSLLECLWEESGRWPNIGNRWRVNQRLRPD